jgi:hypothetical protein
MEKLGLRAGNDFRLRGQEGNKNPAEAGCGQMS